MLITAIPKGKVLKGQSKVHSSDGGLEAGLGLDPRNLGLGLGLVLYFIMNQ